MLYKYFITILIVFQCLIKKAVQDFQFGQLAFEQADEVAATIFITDQPRAVVIRATRYPEHGFYLGLYDLDSCSVTSPAGGCVPNELAGFYERELQIRPDPKPQVFWVESISLLCVTGYFRQEAPTCQIKQYDLGTDFDQIVETNVIACAGEMPADEQPDVLAYFTESRDMLYVKDYDDVGFQWRVRIYDLANDNWGAETMMADEKYFLVNCLRTDVNNPYYAYHEHDTANSNQIDVREIGGGTLRTINLEIDHVNAALMLRTPSLLMAVIHNNYMIVLYNYDNPISTIVHYIFFEVYFPKLEAFKSVLDANGGEMIMVASQLGEDRFIRWMQLDTADNDEEDLIMWKGHTMQLNDVYTYNYQQAVAYDAYQNYLGYMTSEQVYAFVWVDDCQHGAQQNAAGTCTDITCAQGCLSCDAAICIICQSGYTFDDNYICQESASKGHSADDDFVGVFMGFDGPGNYYFDANQNRDLMLSFDLPNKKIYSFDIETEVIDITDLTADVPVNTLNQCHTLDHNQQLLCVEDDGAGNYDMIRRNYITPGTTTTSKIVTARPYNIHDFIIFETPNTYQMVAYQLEGSGNQDFYVMNADSGNARLHTIGTNNLEDQTNERPTFFGADLTFANVLLVLDLNNVIHQFHCLSDLPVPGNPDCTEVRDFPAGGAVIYERIPGYNFFIEYTKGSTAARIQEIQAAAKIQILAFTLQDDLAAGRFIHLSTTTNYYIFVALHFSGTVTVTSFNAPAFNIATLVREIYGFKYYDRDLTVMFANNYVKDPNVYIGWQSSPEEMKIGIKVYENYQTINICGIDGVYNDATATKCDACANQCLRCSAAADNTQCDVCAIGNFKANGATTCDTTCGGIAGQYEDSNFRQCRQCNHPCLTCLASAFNCTACRGNRTGATCVCPANFYEDMVNPNCIICDNVNTPSSCATCIQGVGFAGFCSVCVLNLVNLDADNLCECDATVALTGHAYTQYCTSCTVAPYQAILSDDMTTITVDFEVPIQFQFFDSPRFELNQDDYTYDLCVYILTPATLAQCGEVPKCRRNGNLINIQFGFMPTLVAGGTGIIQFNNNVMQRTDPYCLVTEFLNNHPIETYDDSLAPSTPTIRLEGPSYVTICEEFDVYIFEPLLDGGRGISQITWTTTDPEIIVNEVMTYYTNQNARYFTMPALTLKTGTTYQFDVTFMNYQGQVGSDSITISTYSQEEGPHIRMIQKNYQEFYQQDKIEFEAELSYIRCDSNTGEINYVADQDFKTTWQRLDASPTPTDLEVVLSTTQKFISYTFNSWTLPTYNGYGIRLKAESQGVEAVHQLNFNVLEYPNLMCYIQGGSRIASFNENLVVDAKVLNLDVTTSLQDLGITYTWVCVDMVTFQPCEDNTGAVIALANSGTILIVANTLNEYQTLKFTVTATITSPSVKSCEYEVIITMVDIEQPIQLFNFPEHIMTGQLNLNDVFLVETTIDPNLTPDEALYNIVFLYNNDIVGKKTFSYQDFSVRVMDFWEDVDVTNPYLDLRISVQSPFDYQPSHTMVKLWINYPPQSGQLLVSDGTGGVAMETNYIFQASGFTDEDYDISYRFSYYLLESYKDDDVERGYNPFYSQINILQDFSPRSICQTFLPLPQTNPNTGSYDAVIMVEAMDSKGGVSNATEVIQVNPTSKTRQSEISNLDVEYRKAHNYVLEKKINTMVQIAQQLRQIDIDGCPNCGGNGFCDVLTNECTCLQGYFMRDCSFEKSDYELYAILKMEVYKSLEDLRDIQFKIVNEEQVQKGMTKLVDDYFIGTQLNNTFIKSYITNMDNYININVQQKITKQTVTNNYIYQAIQDENQKTDSLFRILKSCFTSLDSMAYAVNNTAFYGSRRQLSSFTEFQRLKYYKRLVNLTRDTSSMLHEIALPNDITYTLKGRMFNNVVGVKSTSRVLTDVLDADIENDQIEFTVDLYDVEGDGIFHLYDTMVQGYLVNPYRYEPTFPYPEQETACQDVDVFRRGIPTIEISPNVKVRYQFESMNSVNDTYNMCVTRAYNGVWLPPTWTIDDCETAYVRDGSDKLQIVCTCYALNPVSVIDDYLCLYRDCYPEADAFYWYMSLMLYSLIVFFLFFCYLLYKAYVYDRAQMYKVGLEVEEVESEPESEEEEKIIHDRLQVGNVFEYLEGARRGKIKRHKKRDIVGDGEEVNAVDRGGKTEVDIDQLEEVEEYIEVYVRQNCCYAIYKLHELLSIFFFFDTMCRRVFRVMFWYSKAMIIAAASGIFVRYEVDFWYVVLYTHLVALTYDCLICIMKHLMRMKQFLLRLVGFNLGLSGIIIGYIYIIQNPLWEFLLKSNNWAYMFLFTYFTDTFVLQPTLILLKTTIINLAIGNGNKVARFIKWLLIFYEENILFRNLLKAARNVFA